MNKKELVKIVAEQNGMTQVAAKKVVESIVDTIMTSIANGEQVKIAGFGKFSLQPRLAKACRHPKTGEKLHIPGRKVPKFTPGKQFKEAAATPKRFAKKAAATPKRRAQLRRQK